MRFKVLAGLIALNLVASFSFSMPAVDAHGNHNNKGKHLGWYKQKHKNWKNHRGWNHRSSWWDNNRPGETTIPGGTTIGGEMTIEGEAIVGTPAGIAGGKHNRKT